MGSCGFRNTYAAADNDDDVVQRDLILSFSVFVCNPRYLLAFILFVRTNLMGNGELFVQQFEAVKTCAVTKCAAAR